MYKVFLVLCYVLLSFRTRWFFYPYPSGLLHKHWHNLMIASVVMKQPWRIWVNTRIGVKYGFDSVQAAYLNRTEVREYLLHLYVIEDGENDHVIRTLVRMAYLYLGEKCIWPPTLLNTSLLRNQSGYGLSQWEEALLCNASSHWQSPYPVWSLLTNPLRIHNITTTKQSTTKPCGYSMGYTHLHWVTRELMPGVEAGLPTPQSYCSINLYIMGHTALEAITGTTTLVQYLEVEITTTHLKIGCR